MRWNGLWVLVLLPVTAPASCDGRPIEIDPQPVASNVLAVLLGDGRGCPDARPVAEAERVLRLDPAFAERLAIVQLAFIESCRAKPGQYALARETTGSRTFWFGDDGCHMWETQPAPNGSYGVIRVAQTAGFFKPPEASCVSFPGESTIVGSDSISRALVVMRTKATALALAAKVADLQ
jgi:hypothetical protein